MGNPEYRSLLSEKQAESQYRGTYENDERVRGGCMRNCEDEIILPLRAPPHICGTFQDCFPHNLSSTALAAELIVARAYLVSSACDLACDLLQPCCYAMEIIHVVTGGEQGQQLQPSPMLLDDVVRLLSAMGGAP